MLPNRLLGTKAGRLKIEYVGGYAQGITSGTTNVTVTFGGKLTGGLASSASEGDLVVVYFGVGRDGSNLNLSVSGYTEVFEGYTGGAGDATKDSDLCVAYKFMGYTPDTSLTLVGGTGRSSDGGAVVIHVFRNVSTVTPLDAAVTTASGVGTLLCNPSAITPITPGAVILAGGAGARRPTTPLSLPTQGDYSSSDLVGMLTGNSSATTNAVSVGVGYHIWTSGEFDPAVFSYSGINETGDINSWRSATLALCPGEYTPRVTYLNGVNLTNQTSDASRSLTLSSGFSPGDVLIAMTANRAGTAPALLDGYTDILGINSINTSVPRSLRVQYKIATSTSESITWTGAYGYLLAFANFSGIGQVNTTNLSTASATTTALPNLSGLDTTGVGTILAGSYATGIYTATTTPYSLFNGFGARVQENTNDSITGETITSSNALTQVSYAVEIL